MISDFCRTSSASADPVFSKWFICHRDTHVVYTYVLTGIVGTNLTNFPPTLSSRSHFSCCRPATLVSSSWVSSLTTEGWAANWWCVWVGEEERRRGGEEERRRRGGGREEERRRGGEEERGKLSCEWKSCHLQKTLFYTSWRAVTSHLSTVHWSITSVSCIDAIYLANILVSRTWMAICKDEFWLGTVCLLCLPDVPACDGNKVTALLHYNWALFISQCE